MSSPPHTSIGQRQSLAKGNSGLGCCYPEVSAKLQTPQMTSGTWVYCKKSNQKPTEGDFHLKQLPPTMCPFKDISQNNIRLIKALMSLTHSPKKKKKPKLYNLKRNQKHGKIIKDTEEQFC